MKVQVLRPEDLVLFAHHVCRPFAIKDRGDGPREEDARLPRALADMYLGWHGERHLSVLNGLACSPLLRDDGSFYAADGYDAATGLWCERVPDVTQLVPSNPTAEHAVAALHLIREIFCTLCFADAVTRVDPHSGLELVDTSMPPGVDESSFLAALMTAICRASLELAPGILIRAASLSGAGAGKGLLARCISLIAFGQEPAAVSAGGGVEELEKRIAAELIEARPVLMLDNLNNRTFKSDLLASVVTERPARVRLLGRSQMVALNSSALIMLTGNGLMLSEHLARRFLVVELDPRTEDPESRPFETDIKAVCRERRAELLAAALTIWLWGRRAENLKRGLPLGSFERWSRWVRDPLVGLGCKDPAARVGETKGRDSQRAEIAEIFGIWWGRHQDRPVTAKDLHEDVQQALNPFCHRRQFVASRLQQLAGTRIAGWVLLRQAPIGKHGAATYKLQRAGSTSMHPNPGPDGAAEASKGGYAPYAPYAFPPRREIQRSIDLPSNPSDLDGGVAASTGVSGSLAHEILGEPEKHRGHRGHTTTLALSVAMPADRVINADPEPTAPSWRTRL